MRARQQQQQQQQQQQLKQQLKQAPLAEDSSPRRQFLWQLVSILDAQQTG